MTDDDRHQTMMESMTDGERSRHRRRQRRALVALFRDSGSYRRVLTWLSPLQRGAPRGGFLSLREAAAYYRPRLSIEDNRSRYVVARYFNCFGREIWR